MVRVLTFIVASFCAASAVMASPLPQIHTISYEPTNTRLDALFLRPEPGWEKRSEAATSSTSRLDSLFLRPEPGWERRSVAYGDASPTRETTLRIPPMPTTAP
ncbi:hypothetical protein SERLA73DRAFT_178515 [Serpula lacrymans var. lacrymans S7.3]|uniref:Secreted protein n=2 Tax=Serpula lacrymans var. lacrymans TaxID=341189 RepID=F8PRS6_SERL3|nr:uncharacterized protein SERLADRAFT_463002 [Serpula lacrymans var. lacrymans S7.9]EGO00646.1 hypothetical protein SERLA73DRAFT_178515 [Serpula lacrymans var. lacrymans S7.3]EGO26201.1 hypothetical protein SERLADRAFT_463002 [Serpula lacrymans var. lacrymans S7.9]